MYATLALWIVLPAAIVALAVRYAPRNVITPSPDEAPPLSTRERLTYAAGLIGIVLAIYALVRLFGAE